MLWVEIMLVFNIGSFYCSNMCLRDADRSNLLYSAQLCCNFRFRLFVSSKEPDFKSHSGTLLEVPAKHLHRGSTANASTARTGDRRVVLARPPARAGSVWAS